MTPMIPPYEIPSELVCAAENERAAWLMEAARCAVEENAVELPPPPPELPIV